MGYYFEPASPFGGALSFLPQGEMSYTALITMIVMLVALIFSTTYGTYQVHKYYLQKDINAADRTPYLWIMWGLIVMFLATLILAFVLIFSLWFVLLAAWVIQLLGFAAYRYINYTQGDRMSNRDLRKACMMSSGLITFVLLFFL